MPFIPRENSFRCPSYTIVLLLLLLAVPGISTFAQTRENLRQQAEGQLQQMTPEQIEAKIKEYGLTREQAEAKARELGIDLNTYLQQQSKSAPPSQLQQPQSQGPLAPQESALTSVSSKEPPSEARKPAPTGPMGLPYFGYDVFAQVPAAFEPTAAGPVDPEYVVGAGDVLRLTVWGQVEMQSELVVDKEGRIFIPTVGQVLVSGQSLEATIGKLKNQMSRSYSGLVSHPPTVWMDLTIAKLRPKRLYMMGEVEKPGGYTVSSYATVFNTLYSIGGPTVRGSLRDVRVLRGDKLIARVDLYKYFTGAGETDDIRVQNNDVIFVPARGKTVSINLEVRHPAIFELLPAEHLKTLLEYAGGALSTAYLERVQVDRIIPFNERTPGGPERRVIDINFREILNKGKDYDLVDGDRVSVYSVQDLRKNVVTISGAVMRPGRYQLENTPTIRGLVEAAEGLDPKAYTAIAHIFRFNDDLLTQRIIPFSLKEVLERPAADFPLNQRDEVVVYSTEVIETKNRYVTINGEVRSPGRYALRANMTLNDLVPMAGGYTEAAERLEAEVSRVIVRPALGDSIAVLYHPFLPHSFEAERMPGGLDSLSMEECLRRGQFPLQHRDEVLIRPNPSFREPQTVRIEGDIQYPGTYTLQRKGELLSEILERAGGPTSTSYLGGAEFIRRGQRLLVDFGQIYGRKDHDHDVIMMGGDRITIPSRPHTVAVGGEVNKPGLLSFDPGGDVSDYIDRAGGLTDSANYAILTSPTGESRRVNFGFLRSNPTVLEGSSILVTRMPPAPAEGKPADITGTIKDIFAILSGAATIIFIVWQTTK
jgi:protein involved in polysaccharide export with SLBB domain